MILYAVDRTCDQIKIKTKVEYDNILKRDRFHYFGSDELAAKQYIIKRASIEVAEARMMLAKAKARYARCIKKFDTVSYEHPGAK